ncbi:MAG TPA: sialidase family protein [Thermoanaerobaculia bacterium]|nr:sialidase family protein [Thermoanaerobaculia bacterium]
MLARALFPLLGLLLAAVEASDVRILARGGSSFETTVAVSPQSAQRAVVGVMSVAHQGVDFYTTHDGGLSWSAGAKMPTKGTNGREYDDGQGDPVIVADRTGLFHMAMLMTSLGNPGSTAVAASRSTDGGLTWSDPIVVAELELKSGPTREFDDKEWLAVDNTGGPFDGNLYLLWQRIGFASTPLQSRMMFSRSTDRGASWSEPVALTTPSPSGQSQVAIGPNGEVYLAYYRAANNGNIILRTSTDGGVTFGDPLPIPVLPWIGGAIPNTKKATFKAFPTLLCDRSNGPARGTLYMVMGTSTQSVSGQTVGGAAVTRSTDGGRTWSTPKMISTPTTGDAIFPSGAVDEATGELVVAWLDRRDDPTNTLASLYATRSRDGGVTFDAPRRFSTPFSIDADWIGDYYGVSGHDGVWLATFSPSSGEMSAVRLRFDFEIPPRRRAVRK